MQKTFNIDREFVRWFYEDEYPQFGNNRSGVMSSINAPNVLERDYWMRKAFKQGVRVMADETVSILGDWAAACAGLNPELITPAKVFDRAQLNLEGYYQQLELFK